MKLLNALVLLLLISAEAGALEKSYFISKGFANCDKSYNSGSSGTMTESVDFVFDQAEGTLNIEAVFSNEGGATLPNGFQFVLTSENSTSFNHYKNPYFYVDGSSLNNVKVRAYTANRYNEHTKYRREAGPVLSEAQFMAQCNNNPGSWDLDGSSYNPTEAIFPPAAGQNNPSWVSSAVAADVNSNGKITRTFSLILKTAQLASFVPNSEQNQFVCSTYGCWNYASYNLDLNYFDFGDNLTIDFIPVVNNSVTYDSNGLISALSINKCSFCRSILKPTNTAPECLDVSVLPETVQVGQKIDISFKFRDSDTEVTDSFKVSYSGAPEGAIYTHPDNSIFTPAAQNFTVDIEYWPTSTDKDKDFTITPALLQLYGHNNRPAVIGNDCIARFNVIGDVTAPICEIKSQAQSMRTVADNQKKLLKKVQLAQNDLLTLKAELKMKAPNLSSKIVAMDSAARNILNIIPEEFNVCSANYSTCKQTDYSSYYKLYMDTFLQMYCQESSVIRFCSGLNNYGSILFLRLIDLKTEKYLRSGQTKAQAKRTAKNEVNRLYIKKANRLINNNFSAIFTDGLNLLLEKNDFQCNVSIED